MGHILLHARQAPDGQAAGGLGGTIAPGIGGSAVASATAPVDDSGLAIDPDLANAPIPTVPVVTQATSSPIVTSSEPDTPLSSGSSSTDDAKSSSSKSNNTTTIIIVAVAAVAFLLIGIAILVLFYRSNKKKRRQSRRGHWREIESHQSHGGQGPVSGAHPHMHHDSNYGHSQDQFQPHSEGGMFVETKSLYSTRRSVDAPPSLKLDFPTNESFMTSNPFANPSPGSPVPPLPNMPQVQHVQQPQQIMVQHQVDPPSAGFSAPSEYTASYIRSVYSTTGDVQSIAESNHSGGTHSRPRSRSNTLKRGPDRTKNQHELIALDNLIAALDLTEEKKEQTLPDPSLFRAALGGQQQPQTPPQQHSQQPQQYY